MESAVAISDRPLPGKIGRYRILCELGHGAMAFLYLGRAVGPGSFERLFAIKMIHEHLGREQTFVSMFLNEARLCARIHHPNVISVYDVDVDSGRYYLAMDYMSGENLALTLKHTWNRGRPFPIDIASYLVSQTCEGLHAAHELKDSQGQPLDVVHRDVAPQNIMVGYDGTVRVMDFGIAKAADTVSQTRPGSMKGTVAYMAPEQIRAESLDRRVDVFALGVVLWETTVGKRLFKSSNDINTAARVLRMTVPKPSTLRVGYPARLEQIVMKALSRDPKARHQTARELGEELQSFLIAEAMRVTPSDVERFMKDVFGPLYEQRAEMERKASAPVPPDRIQSLPSRDGTGSLSTLGSPSEGFDLLDGEGGDNHTPKPMPQADTVKAPAPMNGDAAKEALAATSADSVERALFRQFFGNEDLIDPQHQMTKAEHGLTVELGASKAELKIELPQDATPATPAAPVAPIPMTANGENERTANTVVVRESRRAGRSGAVVVTGLQGDSGVHGPVISRSKIHGAEETPEPPTQTILADEETTIDGEPKKVAKVEKTAKVDIADLVEEETVERPVEHTVRIESKKIRPIDLDLERDVPPPKRSMTIALLAGVALLVVLLTYGALRKAPELPAAEQQAAAAVQPVPQPVPEPVVPVVPEPEPERVVETPKPQPKADLIDGAVEQPPAPKPRPKPVIRKAAPKPRPVVRETPKETVKEPVKEKETKKKPKPQLFGGDDL